MCGRISVERSEYTNPMLGNQSISVFCINIKEIADRLIVRQNGFLYVITAALPEEEYKILDTADIKAEVLVFAGNSL